jgi:branched-chain amino acid transport system ATP-binding protein
MRLVMDISDHVVVLNFGEIIARGLPADVQRNEEVAKAYLGSGEIGSEVREAVAEIAAL